MRGQMPDDKVSPKKCARCSDPFCPMVDWTQITRSWSDRGIGSPEARADDRADVDTCNQNRIAAVLERIADAEEERDHHANAASGAMREIGRAHV